MRLHVAYVGLDYYPLSWNPLSILGSGQDILLEDSKDPPKTAGAADMPIGGPPPEAYLTTQSASRRLKTPPNASKMPQEASKTPSDASKPPQEASKRPPRRSKIDFSSQHGPPEPQKTLKIY